MRAKADEAEFLASYQWFQRSPYTSLHYRENFSRFLSSSHGFIYVSHRSFFSPSTKRNMQTRGLETFKQNMTVLKKEGIRIVLATLFSFSSFAHLLLNQSTLVNIFLKLYFAHVSELM